MLLCIDNIINNNNFKKAVLYNAAHTPKKDMALHIGDENGPFVTLEWKMWGHQTYNYTGSSLLFVSDLLRLRHGHMSTTSSGTSKHKRDRGNEKKVWGEERELKTEKGGEKDIMQNGQSLFANDEFVTKSNIAFCLSVNIHPSLEVCILLWLTVRVHDKHS